MLGFLGRELQNFMTGAPKHIPCVLVVLLVAASGEARAQSPAEIRYEPPHGCPAATWLNAQIARYLGKPAVGVKAEVVARKRGAGWSVTVRTHTAGGDGEVTHRGPDCSVLVDVAALIVAVAIDPTAGPGKASPKKPAVAGNDEPPPPGPWVEVDDETPPPGGVRFVERERAQRTRALAGEVEANIIRARLTVGSDIGTLPALELGLGVAAQGQVGRWFADLGLWASSSSNAEVEAMPGAGADFRLLAASGRICRDSVRFIGNWAPCVGAEIGQILASSYGVDEPVSERRAWVAATAGLSVSWNLTKSINIRVDNQVGINITRERFRLLGQYIVHQAEPIHWRALAGLERSFR